MVTKKFKCVETVTTGLTSSLIAEEGKVYTIQIEDDGKLGCIEDSETNKGGFRVDGYRDYSNHFIEVVEEAIKEEEVEADISWKSFVQDNHEGLEKAYDRDGLDGVEAFLNHRNTTPFNIYESIEGIDLSDKAITVVDYLKLEEVKEEAMKEIEGLDIEKALEIEGEFLVKVIKDIDHASYLRYNTGTILAVEVVGSEIFIIADSFSLNGYIDYSTHVELYIEDKIEEDVVEEDVIEEDVVEEVLKEATVYFTSSGVDFEHIVLYKGKQSFLGTVNNQLSKGLGAGFKGRSGEIELLLSYAALKTLTVVF